MELKKLAVLLTSFAATHAFANDYNFISADEETLKREREVYVIPAVTFSSSQHTASSGSDQGVQLTVGTALKSWLNIEANYSDLGSLGGGVEVTSTSLSSVHRRAFSHGWELLAEGGLARIETQFFNETYHTTAPLLGVGLAYELTDGMSLESRYKQIFNAGKSGSMANDHDIEVLSLGLKIDL